VLSLNSISVGVSLVLGIFSTKIISIFLGAPGMAILGSFRNFTTMAKSLATLGINNSIIKLFIENKEDKKELGVIYTTFFWIFLIVSIGVGSVILIFSSSISVFLCSDATYTVPIDIFAFGLPLIVLNTFWLAIYNGLQQFRKIVTIQIISNIVVFVITALFVWDGNIRLGLLALAFSEIAVVAVTFIFIRQNREHFRFDLKQTISKPYLKIIRNFSIMALLSALLAPLTLMLIRNQIMEVHSVEKAGIWDGINRLSGFYMVFFNSGLSLYYIPKLSALKTDMEFKKELGIYFKTLVPLFAAILFVIFILRGIIVNVAFTPEFYEIKGVLIWQLAGDLLRIMSLAFGFQILIKTMMKEYFMIEIVFNILYITLSVCLMKVKAVEGVVQAYFWANVVCFIMVVVIFRKLLFWPRSAPTTR
jgi:O-antigen/teichoic acid export membrane protein